MIECKHSDGVYLQVKQAVQKSDPLMRIPAAIIKREPALRRLMMAMGIGLLLSWMARDIIRAYDGDFKVHWETGRRFLAGEFLYAGGHDFPYPPFLGMMFAPAALLPVPTAKTLFYPLGVAALLLLFWVLRRLVQPAFALDETPDFWTAALALFLAVQFILRDQAELGLNTAVTAFIWLAVYLWRQDRDLLSGMALGLAIAIKCTPAIFLAYFVWKRQWRVASCTVAAAIVFNMLPMLWQGPSPWSDHMRAWTVNAVHGISGTGSDFGASEMARTKNMSLRPSLMGYMARLPENASRSWDPHPIESLNLSPVVASWVVNSVLLSIVAIYLWWSSGRVRARDEPRLLWEFAATGVLMLLFSPITWGQHCVALLPACYLIAAVVVVRDRLPRWITVLLSLYAVFCALLGRDLIGRDLSGRFAAYHISTFCIVGLFAIVLAGPRLHRKCESHDSRPLQRFLPQTE